MDYGDEAALDAFDHELQSQSSGQYRWTRKSKRKESEDDIDLDLTDLEEGWE
ncbi:MAG: hypothetical protein F6K09_13805 [Merismopedia sp. SIO2A8]|nr:hypothetical protein [Merismopedia sp. SIO2A8]